jgi:hypothetical protein
LSHHLIFLEFVLPIIHMVFTHATLIEIYDCNVGMISVFEPVSYSWHTGMWPHLSYRLSTVHAIHIIWTYHVQNQPCVAFSELSLLQHGWWLARSSSQELHGMGKFSIRVYWPFGIVMEPW